MVKAKKKRNKWFTQEMKVTEFVVDLGDIVGGSEVKVVFFIGAGCSISSGIPGANKLVLKWLEFLKRKETGNLDGLDKWAKGRIPGYDPKDPAAKYGEVLFEACPDEKRRQLEIEKICANAKPELGYILLAQLMSDKKYGPHFNAVLTTNFDDLIAEAFYLYSYDRPKMYVHESLYKYIDIDTIKPFVIKLHGDAHYDPKSTKLETLELEPKVKDTINHLLYRKALVFLGYGGNDNSIAKFLEGLKPDHMKWGVYFVKNGEPGDRLKEALIGFEDVKRVRHSDFDELMFHIASEFDLGIPTKQAFIERYETVERIYEEALGRFQEAVPEIVDDEEREALEGAVRETAKQFDDWWAVELEARKYKETGTGKTDEIYRDGLKQFPESHQLLGNYANFLTDIKGEHDAAEGYYKRAIKADPYNAIILGNYANFLTDIKGEHDAAEKYYKRALEADPNNANKLGNYASFLHEIREDYDAAEEYYKRAIKADPEVAVYLGNYAVFLWKVRENYPAAEDYYKRAIKADPDDAINLGNYAGLLLAQGKTEEGFKILAKSQESDPIDKQRLENLFYYYAHFPKEPTRTNSLKQIKELITSGVRSPNFDLSQNVARATEDGHPEPELLALLAKVITDEADASELDQFEVWKNA